MLTLDDCCAVVVMQVKLLNVYIKRALEQRGQPGGYTISETASPVSAVDNL